MVNAEKGPNQEENATKMENALMAETNIAIGQLVYVNHTW
jgi:hypothetical protein